jgi:hypothetical protein
MPSIRLPESAEPLLKFCRRHEQSEDNACFETYADLLVFAASCGYQRLSGRPPADASAFLRAIYPIDIGVFKNQGLFPNLLLIGLGATGKADVARDEEGLCRLVEAYADVGCKRLGHKMIDWTPARFHLECATLLRTAADPGNGDAI